MRNNCLKGAGYQMPAFAAGGTAKPARFEGNHLSMTPVPAVPTYYYLDNGTGLTSLAQVNALTGMIASGNDAVCP